MDGPEIKSTESLLEDPVLIPSTHMATHNHLYNSSPTGFVALFWLLWATRTHGACTHTVKTLIHITKKLLFVRVIRDYVQWMSLNPTMSSPSLFGKGLCVA